MPFKLKVIRPTPILLLYTHSEVAIQSEPNLRSETLFKLHEGTKVQVLDIVDDWKKIKLTDGKTGWMPRKGLKEL